jgi:hypothetical protein
MDLQKNKLQYMFHLAIAVLIGVGLAYGYNRWIKKE